MNLIGLRDRAILAVLAYSGSRIGPVARLTLKDLLVEGEQWVISFNDKGGKLRTRAAIMLPPQHRQCARTSTRARLLIDQPPTRQLNVAVPPHYSGRFPRCDLLQADGWDHVLLDVHRIREYHQYHPSIFLRKLVKWPKTCRRTSPLRLPALPLNRNIGLVLTYSGYMTSSMPKKRLRAVVAFDLSAPRIGEAPSPGTRCQRGSGGVDLVAANVQTDRK